MKAIVRIKGGKDFANLQVQDLPSAPLAPDQVRITMVSSRVNPVDLDLMKGMPFLKYKKPQIGGIDGAGTVSEVGSQVTGFEVGDAVFFYRRFTDIGTWAEEITIGANDIARIPGSVDVAEAGSIALPLLTAYGGIKTLKPHSGDTILIHGAAGGVGFLAVQVAHALGLQVVGTASKRDFPLLEEAGVSRLIDYRSEQFEQVLRTGEVDQVFDTQGGKVLLNSLGLKPKKVVSVKHIDPKEMHKTGLKFPGILLSLMALAGAKARKVAKRNGVQLHGLVTGANGALLQEAADLLGKTDFQAKVSPTRTLSEIAVKGMSAADVGRVILFGS